jgi:hypothetical protein
VIAAAETSMRQQQIKEIRDRYRANPKPAGQEWFTPGTRLVLMYVATMLATFTIAWVFYLLM